jgi:hypothetical protein
MALILRRRFGGAMHVALFWRRSLPVFVWTISVAALAQGCSTATSETPDAEARDAVAPSDVAAQPDARSDTSAPCPDADGDGSREMACGGDDCDDADPNRFPGRSEVCDTTDHDEDCDPRTFGVRDADADGAADGRCCNVDTDGARRCGVDCDDANATSHPGSTEVCDFVDNDCDAIVDEMVSDMLWPDADGDGFGDGSASPTTGCAGGGYAAQGGDCDDADPHINPSSPEVCNGYDDDCNGLLDGPLEDMDGDGYASPACAGTRGTDCDEGDATIHPGAPDACDGIDQSCDGVDHEGGPCVQCGTAACDAMAGGMCCGNNGVPSTCGTVSCSTSCGFLGTRRGPFECDGPEDCAAGSRCAWARCDGGLWTTACSATATIDIACHVDADCLVGEICSSTTHLCAPHP